MANREISLYYTTSFFKLKINKVIYVYVAARYKSIYRFDIYLKMDAIKINPRKIKINSRIDFYISRGNFYFFRVDFNIIL